MRLRKKHKLKDTNSFISSVHFLTELRFDILLFAAFLILFADAAAPCITLLELPRLFGELMLFDNLAFEVDYTEKLLPMLLEAFEFILFTLAGEDISEFVDIRDFFEDFAADGW